MKDDKQIQMAFALWQNMARLGMWHHYDKEFLQLLLDSKEKEENQKDDSQDFVF